MKRMMTVVMVILLVIPFCGCKKGNDVRDPVNFYYCTDPVDYNSADAVLSPEIREGEGYGDDLQALLDIYLDGPITAGFRSPFPSGVYVETITSKDDLVTVSLSKEFAQLTDYTLTLACAGLSMTLMDLTGCETVRVQVTDSQLGGSEYIEMNHNNLLFLDAYSSGTDE